jgi:hypothetical protein
MRKSWFTPGWPMSCVRAASNIAIISNLLKWHLTFGSDIRQWVACVTSAACVSLW